MVASVSWAVIGPRHQLLQLPVIDLADKLDYFQRLATRLQCRRRHTGEAERFPSIALSINGEAGVILINFIERFSGVVAVYDGIG